MKRLPILAGRSRVIAHALVDDEDLDWVLQWRWSFSSQGYVRRRAPDVYLHREVGARMLGRSLAFADQVHHRYGQKLDHRRSQLVVVDALAHKAHHHPNPGARFDRSRGRWVARPTIDGRKVFLGCHKTEAEAAAAIEVARATA